MLGGMIWGFACGMFLFSYFAWGLPGVDDVKPLDARPSITILARDGSLITRYGGLKGVKVQVRDLPPYVPQAVLAIEDRRFYRHPGIDPLGLARAMLANLRAMRWVQGGSTITQQLAKNLFLTPDKTLKRKVQEAMLALKLERRYAKDEILSAYLNRVYFGAGAYGLDAAARTYFSKPAEDLTLWESALLAGLLKAPSRYSPAADPEAAQKRARVVIAAMQDAGYIGEQQEQQELTRVRLRLPPDAAAAEDLKRYFADWIIGQVDSFVSNNDRDLIIRTTFEPELQAQAAGELRAMMKSLKPEDKIGQAAVVTLARDGAVLAMIGGVDYAESQFNRAAQAMRQPGSAFKPVVFLAALEAGFSPDDLVEDAPFTEGSYRPENYNREYYGPVTLTDALALSLNTATIRLLQETGVNRMLDTAQRLGFTQKFRPELATGLGAGETNLLELTNAYAVIANGGHAVWPYGVLSIEETPDEAAGEEGEVLYQYAAVDHARLFARQDIDALNSMLVQVVARGTGRAAQLSRGHVAGKTGTSQNYRDAWFIGYTDNIITGVWMGNDDDSPMNRVSGGRYPARLWHDYMEQAIGVPVQSYTEGLSRPSGGGFFDMISRWSEQDEDASQHAEDQFRDAIESRTAQPGGTAAARPQIQPYQPSRQKKRRLPWETGGSLWHGALGAGEIRGDDRPVYNP